MDVPFVAPYEYLRPHVFVCTDCGTCYRVVDDQMVSVEPMTDTFWTLDKVWSVCPHCAEATWDEILNELGYDRETFAKANDLPCIP